MPIETLAPIMATRPKMGFREKTQAKPGIIRI
jgi:hypothetical protein